MTKERILNRQRKFCEFLPKRFSIPVFFRFGRFALLFRFVTVSAICWPNTLTALKLPVLRLPMYCGTILNAPDPILHKQLDSVCCQSLIRLFKQRHPKCSLNTHFTQKQKYVFKDIREWLFKRGLKEKASRGQRHYAENCALSVTVKSNLMSRGWKQSRIPLIGLDEQLWSE